MMTTSTMRRRPAPKVRPVPDARIRPAETVCPAGHDFGLDRQRFFAAHGRRATVTCPVCAAPALIPEEHRRQRAPA